MTALGTEETPAAVAAVANAARATRPRAFTPRALALGAALTALFAVLAPINDWVVGNTYLYSHYLPPGVVLVIVLLALVVNPLLGARRFAMGEQVVIVAMLLALGGTCSSGFARLWTQVACGPARLMPRATDLDAIAPRDAPTALPRGFFVGVPADAPIDADDAEHRLVVDGYHDGLSRTPRVEHRALVTWRDASGIEHAQRALSGAAARAARPGTFLDLDAEPGRSLVGRRAGDRVALAGGEAAIIAIEPPAIPWHAWWPVALRWAPLVGGAIAAMLAIAGLVRDQWIVHERLSYPIAAFLAGLLAEPEPGRRLPPLLRTRAFWLGMLAAGIVLGSQGLKAMGLSPVAIPTELDLAKAADTPALHNLFQWWALVHPRVYLSIAALTFFLPLDLSFSLWASFIGTAIAYAALRLNGVGIERSDAAPAGVGGFAAECLLILWVGRAHYLGALKAAFTRDPAKRELAWYARALFIGIAAMAATLVAAGARPDHALLAILVFLGLVLVLARLVAEAGIPFVQIPVGWFVSQIVFSITGFAAPPATLAPLVLVGTGLLPDSRENLLPYAVQAEYLAVRADAPRGRLSLAMGVVALAGAAACAAILVAIWYRHDHQPNGWPLESLISDNLQPLARGLDGHDTGRARVWLAYGIGAALVGAVGIGRMLFAWWPLHPLGLLIVPAYSTWVIWASFLVGWVWKLAVMRYGGTGVYQRLKPFAAGLIAGEAAMAGIFLVVGLIRHACGLDVGGLPRFLPG